MMDSQELNPVQENLEEQPKHTYATKQEVLERVKELAHGEETPQKAEVDILKTVFYKLHLAEREAQMKEYLDNGGNPEEYRVMPDADEDRRLSSNKRLRSRTT